jgi:hypothetical protein
MVKLSLAYIYIYMKNDFFCTKVTFARKDRLMGSMLMAESYIHGSYQCVLLYKCFFFFFYMSIQEERFELVTSAL